MGASGNPAKGRHGATLPFVRFWSENPGAVKISHLYICISRSYI